MNSTKSNYHEWTPPQKGYRPHARQQPVDGLGIGFRVQSQGQLVMAPETEVRPAAHDYRTACAVEYLDNIGVAFCFALLPAHLRPVMLEGCR